MEWLLKAVKTAEFWWVAFGFAAQLLFFLRFLVQWIASERAGKSVMPTAFWYLSLSGGVMLFTYAIYRRDPVFIAGQSLGVLIYVRNIVLINKHRMRGPRQPERGEEQP